MPSSHEEILALMRESRTWEVKCPKCGEFVQLQKGEPVICPQCGEPDIDTEPVP